HTSFSRGWSSDVCSSDLDVNGCEASKTFTLNNPVAPVLTLTPDPDTICYTAGNPVEVTASVNAGTGLAPFNFELNTGETNDTGIFSNLTPGSYTITVTDANGCIGDETFDIEPELRVTATADDMSACDTDTNITIN